MAVMNTGLARVRSFRAVESLAHPDANRTLGGSVRCYFAAYRSRCSLWFRGLLVIDPSARLSLLLIPRLVARLEPYAVRLRVGFSEKGTSFARCGKSLSAANKLWARQSNRKFVGSQLLPPLAQGRSFRGRIRSPRGSHADRVIKMSVNEP